MTLRQAGLLAPVLGAAALALPCLGERGGDQAKVEDAPPIAARQPAASSEPPRLARDSVLRRPIAVGETHVYRIRLRAGDYVQVLAMQRGSDVSIVLYGLDGESLLTVDSPNGTAGPELLAAVARDAGEYRLTVGTAVACPRGAYVLRVEKVGRATGEDRRRAAAVAAFAAAEQLRAQASAASLRAAVERYQEALEHWRRLADPLHQAMALRRLGQAWYSLGDVRRANRAAREALALARALEDPVEEARLLNEVGATYRVLGEPGKAAESYERALQLAGKTGDRHEQATAVNNLGVLYFSISETQRALSFLERARAMWQQLEDPAREADALHNLGECYTLLARPEVAIDLVSEALARKRQVGDRRGQAAALAALGWAHYRSGELLRALAGYEASLRLRRELGDRRGEAATLDRRGTVLSRLGRKQEALASHRAALAILQAVGDRLSEAHVLASIGWLYESWGRPTEALSYFARCLRIFRQIGDQHGTAYALLGDARVAWRLGRLERAQSQVEAALEIVESMRSEVQSRALRSSYLASRQDYYEIYVQILMGRQAREPGQGWEARALAASSRARARSLLESLAEARVDPLAEATPAERAAAQSLAARIRAREERRLEILGDPAARREVATLERELRELLLDQAALEDRMRRASPRYAALTHSPPLSARDIQALLDRDTLLLWYGLGGEESFLWVVGSDSLASYRLPPRTEIEAAARQAYDLMAQSHQQGTYHRARLAARALSDMILAPAGGGLADKRLLIASDGALQYVPFAALPVVPAAAGAGSADEPQPVRGGRVPLLAEHEIVHIPSAAVLALVRRGLAGRRPAPKALAVVADPVFHRDDRRLRQGGGAAPVLATAGETSSGFPGPRPASELERAGREAGLAGFDRLDHAATEAAAILALVPEPERLEVVGFAASRATVMSGRLERYRIVHFATHGLLNARHPELSGVVLSLVDEQGRPQDGFLRVQDIVHLSFPAELVVLSACRTALGSEVRGEGLVGLTHAFFIAGAGRVVVSLWNVNDRATAELMERFYRRLLQQGHPPAAALREAQLAMLREEPWAPPYFWAGFVLQGEWR